MESRSRKLGRPIPFATLAKVEQGKVDPGLRRLHALLKIYDLPLALAQDVLDLEEFAGELPGDVRSTTLYEDAVRYWRAGDLRQGFAHLAELRVRTAESSSDRVAQQKTILAIAVTVGSLGRHRLSRFIVDELLLTPPEPVLLVPALVQAAACWHWLGSGEVALGFLARAEANAVPGDHRHCAWIAHERASTYASMGRPAEAQQELSVAIAEYSAAGETYGECRARGIRVRLLVDRGEFDAAHAAAVEARELSAKHGHRRLAVMRMLDEGRIRVAQGRFEEGIRALSAGLGESAAAQDNAAQFHAHYYLWKAYSGAGEPARAEIELTSAQYFEQFLDAAGPEAEEVRAAAAARAPSGARPSGTPRGARSLAVVPAPDGAPPAPGARRNRSV